MINFIFESFLPSPLFLILIIFLLLNLIIFSIGKPFDVEKHNGNLIYKKHCGACVGLIGVSGVVATIYIFDNLVVIKFFRSIFLKYSEIESIEVMDYIFQKRLFIKHNNPNFPKKVIIISLDANKMKEIIEENIKKSS